MKKILLFLFIMMGIVFSSTARESEDDSSSENIELEFNSKTDGSVKTIHRSLIHIDIKAFYDQVNHTINIIYEGGANGRSYLYLDEILVNQSPEINATFPTDITGSYKLEIISENWVAVGYLNL